MRALMLAMAMQESTHMDVRERDASKDGRTDKAANATIFNLSVVSATLLAAQSKQVFKVQRQQPLVGCSQDIHRRQQCADAYNWKCMRTQYM
jgi:hypothetical protein